jgi:NAD(P)-dependent dehydrogenase (short-subunit alcohol dehydrogenase family)
MSLNKNFDNKVVLVTGSNSGIGESTVILFSKLGAKCVVTGRNETKNFEVAKKCEEVSPHKYKALTVRADVGKEEDIDKLIDSVISHYGRLDVLVNNAAKGGGKESETLEEFDEYIRVDLRSVYQLCIRSLPYLEKTKGAIINISSITALKPYPNVSYCVAKAGLDMMTRCLALNWGPKGIRVNGLNPGQIDTPIWNDALDKEQIEAMWKGVDAKYPLRRRGYPEDIAKAIVFLASEDSSFITGVNIKIDGGHLDSASLIWD